MISRKQFKPFDENEMYTTRKRQTVSNELLQMP